MASVRNSKASHHATAQNGYVVAHYYDDKGNEIKQKASSTTIANSSTTAKTSQPSSLSSSANSANQKNSSVDNIKKADFPNKNPIHSIGAKKSDLPLIKPTVKSGLPFFTKTLEAVSKKILVPYLDLQTLNALASHQKKGYTIFNPILKTKQLLEFIAHGNQAKAEEIIKKDPTLLMKRDTVKTYAEDTIQDVNPLELAYGEDDNDMFKMMLPYLNQLPQNTKANLFNQLKVRFPETKEEKYDFDPLVAAITQNDAKVVETELEKFRNDFAPQVLKEGKLITRITQALEQAIQVYTARH